MGGAYYDKPLFHVEDSGLELGLYPTTDGALRVETLYGQDGFGFDLTKDQAAVLAIAITKWIETPSVTGRPTAEEVRRIRKAVAEDRVPRRTLWMQVAVVEQQLRGCTCATRKSGDPLCPLATSARHAP